MDKYQCRMSKPQPFHTLNHHLKQENDSFNIHAGINHYYKKCEENLPKVPQYYIEVDKNYSATIHTVKPQAALQVCNADYEYNEDEEDPLYFSDADSDPNLNNVNGENKSEMPIPKKKRASASPAYTKHSPVVVNANKSNSGDALKLKSSTVISDNE